MRRIGAPDLRQCPDRLGRIAIERHIAERRAKRRHRGQARPRKGTKCACPISTTRRMEAAPCRRAAKALPATGPE